MSMQRQFIVRFREDGYVRFQIPLVCTHDRVAQALAQDQPHRWSLSCPGFSQRSNISDPLPARCL